MSNFSIQVAQDEKDFAEGKHLFVEYAESLGFSLCFQGFDKEIEALSSMYAPPTGYLLLLKQDENAIGCVGIRKFNEETAELKRMYIKSAFRGKGIGAKLLQSALVYAKNLQYTKICLDTLPKMQQAIKLYQQNGFYEISPYYQNPVEGAIFLEKGLV